MRRSVKVATFAAAFAIIASSVPAKAQLRWNPVNPWFGGNAYNGSWLLSQAQAHRPSPAKAKKVEDPIADFQKSLQRQIMTRLALQLVQGAFGDSAMTQGTYVIGDFSVTVQQDDDGISVNLINAANGTSTTVEIPVYY
jgi:curli production assembly/transport component CsgF